MSRKRRENVRLPTARSLPNDPANAAGRDFGQQIRQAIAFLRHGDLASAEKICRTILVGDPNNFDSLHLLGTLAAQRGSYEEAEGWLTRALTIHPASAEAHSNLGNVQRARGRPAEALACYERALALKPVFIDALNNRGGALKDLERFSEALASYDRSLALRPDSHVAHYNRGAVLSALKRHEEALDSYERALALKTDFVEALNNRGCALAALKRHREAVASYDRALMLRPAFAQALENRGVAFAYLGRHEEAVEAHARALKLDPALPFARGALLHSRMHCCDWRTYEDESRQVLEEVREGKPACEPFALLAVADSPEDQRRCAETWVRDQCPPWTRAQVTTGARYDHRRIRLAYVSSDFRAHPLGHLMAALFERHDRKRFEVIAVSTGPDDRSPMRSRLERAFDRFVDVRDRSDRDVAKAIRELEVDIAVDRNGYASGARPGIFALRPAPIQVSYLAYPATTGADYIDYIIADRVVLPHEHRRFYSESVVYLPDTYLVTDSARPIAEGTPTRAQAGLPERGFVFCSFNNLYKVTPQMFDVWMRLLKRIDGSVLWLLAGATLAQRNLRSEAARRGVDPGRLVFAPRIAPEAHLARHRLADLFLDTLPCNAHTTACDALWAGLPVLTQVGTTFAGRVAASLLQACGVPELITDSKEAYESLALRLAGEPSLLAAIEQKLARNRLLKPLFDTDRFRRHIEVAFWTMWERHQRGAPPSDFAVRPLDA